jgi:hypothetical protein
MMAEMIVALMMLFAGLSADDIRMMCFVGLT